MRSPDWNEQITSPTSGREQQRTVSGPQERPQLRVTRVTARALAGLAAAAIIALVGAGVKGALTRGSVSAEGTATGPWPVEPSLPVGIGKGSQAQRCGTCACYGIPWSKG